MDTHADRQTDHVLLPQPFIQHAERFDHPKTSTHRPLGIIFVRPGIAKVHQQPIAQILRNMALKALDDRGTGGLVHPHHVPQVFRIQLRRERCRLHQVTEQHRELAALGVRRVESSWWRGRVGQWHYGGGRRRHRLESGRGWF